ncbi:unnamed protein product [Adineta steineri]|uniref:Uncharacterized protein n=1 Tax=Adineta steineri TaxID=433720 RepID=A0A814RBL7_9BILA|nr:unnamed protein product [Adineta steineri]CAF1449367.1 unnamed protein product [Adineta steineri]
MDNSNNTTEVDDSQTVTSNTTQPPTLCEHSRKRKLVWNIFIVIIFIISITTAPIVVLLKTKANSEKTSTTGTQNETIIHFEVTPSKINPFNTIYAVWNVSAGLNSLRASAGTSMGHYWYTESPQNVFDGNLTSGICSYGRCNYIYDADDCGQNTGLYATAQDGAFILSGFRIAAGHLNRNRDPLLITIEGSNLAGSTLTLGSSWTLIYSGTSGLSIDPGRNAFGQTQVIANNNLAFTSYRILIIRKHGYDTCVGISEIQLLNR